MQTHTWGALALLVGLGGCERGCAAAWVREAASRGERPVESARTGGLGTVDCPDGLARCAEGHVEASRLTAIPQPCRGPESACSCPWEPVAPCPGGCVVDGLEVVMGKEEAAAQLCAPPPGAPLGTVAAPPPRADPGQVAGCDEEQLYRCTGGAVVDCGRHAVVASCMRGCVPGTDGIWANAIAGDPASGGTVGSPRDRAITREAAYAILCSR